MFVLTDFMRFRRCLPGLMLIACLGLLIGQPAQAGVVSQEGGNLLVDRSHGNGEAWGKSKCSNCHTLQRMHAGVPKIKAVVDSRGFTTCTGCHGSNGTKASRQCTTCHNSKDMPLSPLRGGKHRHDFNTVKDFKTSSKQCVVCHDNSDMDGTFELDKDLAMFDDAIYGEMPYQSISEFCLRCHNDEHQQKAWPLKNAKPRDQSLRADDYFHRVDVHGVPGGDGRGWYNGLRSGTYEYKSVVECTDCHTLHGTKNPNLIIEDARQGLSLLDKTIRDSGCKVVVKGVLVDHACAIAVDGVEFTNSAGKKTKVDKGDYRDLCVMCHNMTTVGDGGDTPAPNGLSGVHTDQGTDCKGCHNHGEATQKGL